RRDLYVNSSYFSTTFPPVSTLFPYTTLFRSQFVVAGVIRDIGLADPGAWGSSILDHMQRGIGMVDTSRRFEAEVMVFDGFSGSPDRKSTRLNSSHVKISYAVFCLKKNNTI